MLSTKPSIVLHVTSRKVTLLSPTSEGIYSPANVKTYSLKSSLFSGKDNPRQRDLSSLSLLSTLKSTKPLHTITVSVPVVTLGLSARGVVESIQSVNQVSMVLIDALVAVSSHAPGLALYVRDSRNRKTNCVSSLSDSVSPSTWYSLSLSESAVIFPAPSMNGFFEVALVSTRSNIAILYSSFSVSPIPNPLSPAHKAILASFSQ